MSDPADISVPTAASSTEGRLVRHVDALYAFAQALTLDEQRAAELVEETSRRGARLVLGGTAAGEERRRLLELLVQVHRERHPAPAGPPTEAASTPVAAEPAPPIQRRLAEQYLSTAVPVAVAGLPEDLRTVLFLCDAEGIPCGEAARVLGVLEGEACGKLESARARVRESVYAGATVAERDLLDQSLHVDWLSGTLGQVLRSPFSPTPAALRASVANIAGAPERPAGEAPRPEETTPVLPSFPPRPGQRRAQSRERGVLIAAVLILTTGLLGLLAARYVRESGDKSLVSLAARQAEEATVELQTDRPEEAEAFAQEELGLRLTLPEIDGGALQGAGAAEVAPDVEIPVFLYQDQTTGSPVVLYALSYALLDRHAGRITLGPDVLNQIEAEDHYDLHDLGGKQVLVWRNRDDIFVAVTWGNADALRQRIFFPS